MLEFEVLAYAGAAPLDGACSSYVVTADRSTLLLDCGPGPLERLWRRGLRHLLDAIVISHMHVDDCLDLVLLSGEVTRSLLGARRPALYVPRGAGRAVLSRLDAALSQGSAQSGRFEDAFAIGEYEPGDALSIGKLGLTFAATEHAQPCLAVRVTDGRSVIVCGADGGPSEDVASLARDADLLVLEATFVDDDDAAARRGRRADAPVRPSDGCRAARP